MFFRLMASLLRLSSKTLRGTYRPIRGLLGGNLFRNRWKNRVLSAFSFRFSSKKYNFMQPLFRVSYRQTNKFRQEYNAKRGFFTAKNIRVNDDVWKYTQKDGLTFSEGWDFKDRNFFLWYITKVGMNTFTDQIYSPNSLPNHAAQNEIKKMGGTTKAQREEFDKGFAKSVSQVFAQALLNLREDLKDTALDTRSELEKAYDLMHLNSLTPQKVQSSSFPNSPMSWLGSGLYSGPTNTAALTTQKGSLFAVHMNQNGFDKMAGSIQPGKVLWDGPWFFKRRASLKDRNVRRRARRKGII